MQGLILVDILWVQSTMEAGASGSWSHRICSPKWQEVNADAQLAFSFVHNLGPGLIGWFLTTVDESSASIDLIVIIPYRCAWWLIHLVISDL